MNKKNDSKWVEGVCTACIIIGFLATFIFIIYSTATNKEENITSYPCSCSCCIERENNNG